MASNDGDFPMHDPNEDSDSTTDEDSDSPSPNPGNKVKRTQDEGSSVCKETKRQRSKVWNHFTKQKDNKEKANCNYCGKEMKAPSKSGTSNMKRHKKFHCKAYNVWKAARKYKDQTVLGTDGEGGNMKLFKISESVVREATNEMLLLGELPLSFIESLAWKHFTTRTKMCKPVSRRTSTRDIVQMYVQKKEAMKKIIRQNKHRLSLTTDIWVATHTGASYMVITAHFVDASWELKKLIIGFKNIYDHKGKTIYKVLLDCLAEWDIKRVFCITVDNATANTSAIRRFKEEFNTLGDDALVLKGEFLHLRCATHIINLVVKEGLHEVDDNVNAIRNGIYFVRSSTPRLNSFEQHVESGKVQKGSLPLDVPTRWNSTYLMLEQAMKFKIAFEKMKEHDMPYNKYFSEKVNGRKRIGPPVKSDWEALDRLVEFLSIFYSSTLILSASTYACSHKLYNEIVYIIRSIKALIPTSDSGGDKMLRQKAESMLVKVGKYWDPFGEEVDFNRLVIVATVFDPRKKMKYAQICFEKLYGKGSDKVTDLCDSVMDILTRLFYKYSDVVNKAGCGGSSTSTGGSSQSQELFRDEVSERSVCRKGQSMDDIFEELRDETSQDKATELKLYLKEGLYNPTLLKGSEFDVLKWWRINSPKFPILSLIARDILAMQVSSVASESAFSTSGRILEPSRSCLTHYMIEVLMCTEQWLKCEVKVNDRGVTRKEQLLADIEEQDEIMEEFEPAFQKD